MLADPLSALLPGRRRCCLLALPALPLSSPSFVLLLNADPRQCVAL
jgi:hypothetical protein